MRKFFKAIVILAGIIIVVVVYVGGDYSSGSSGDIELMFPKLILGF